MEEIGSIGDDMEWDTGRVQARIEHFGFAHAGSFEGVVPSIYATLCGDVLVNELSVIWRKPMGRVNEKHTVIFDDGGTVMVNHSPRVMVNNICGH